eukprot:scaffold10064_cov130-Isochrysis_galbana.AAC.5
MSGASESARPHLHPGIVLFLPFPARPGAPAPGCPRAATALQLQRTDARKSRDRTGEPQSAECAECERYWRPPPPPPSPISSFFTTLVHF